MRNMTARVVLALFLAAPLHASAAGGVDGGDGFLSKEEKQAHVAQAQALLASLQQQATNVSLIVGAQGPTGQPGMQGEQGPKGVPGEGVSEAEAQALKDELLEKSYIQPARTPEEFYENIDGELRTYQIRLQFLLDVLEDIEVGDSVDYTEPP